MTSPFDAAAASAAAAVDAVLGERFEYRPMRRSADVNARFAADPSRAVVTGLLAVFGEPSARADAGPVRTPGVEAERPGHATARPFLALALSRLPYAPAVGDRVLRSATGVVYRVAEILPSHPGFVRLDLNKG